MPQHISPAIIGQAEKFLLYGDPGVGKTHCALTAPPPIYYVCTGMQEDELQTYYSKRFLDKKDWKGRRMGDRIKESDVIVDSVDLAFHWGEANASGFDMVKDLIEKAVEAEARGEIQFNTIVIDNITTLTELQIEKAITLTDAAKDVKSKTKSTLEKYEEHGVMQVTDYEWKDVQTMMAKFLSELFRVRKNMVIIAHEWEQVKNDRATQTSTSIAVKPLFIGKQRDLVANLFSNVWRIYPQAQFSAARTTQQGQNPSILAKTRIGGILQDDYLDPDLSYVIEKFKEHAEKMSAQSAG